MFNVNAQFSSLCQPQKSGDSCFYTIFLQITFNWLVMTNVVLSFLKIFYIKRHLQENQSPKVVLRKDSVSFNNKARNTCDKIYLQTSVIITLKWASRKVITRGNEKNYQIKIKTPHSYPSYLILLWVKQS